MIAKLLSMETQGRRERKKLQTRQLISDVATELFMARGFDHVTVADVAKAADVAVQTVFNHFPTKEDLLFDEDAWWLGPVRAIREAGPGAGAVEVLEQYYLDEIRMRLRSEHLVTWKAFARTIEESPALLARRRKNADEMEILMVQALQERDPELGPLQARVIAAQYQAAQKVLEAELARVLPEQPEAGRIAQYEEAMEQAAAVVFGALKHGLRG
ncbi:TetR/AcrR family transcriptional regulator [Kribbella sp. NPDC051718]|uniref:TetR/AcrR family transcriptional regulator n=1 Tax=Kribbella sp. NPDC051718 TaxID=3155168 RepID=UPI00343F2DCC